MILNINEYKVQDRIDLLQDIYVAERQIKTGKTSSYMEVKENILKRLKMNFECLK